MYLVYLLCVHCVYCVAAVGPALFSRFFGLLSPLRAAHANNMVDTLVHKLDMKLQQFFRDIAHALGESDSDNEFVQFAQQVFEATEDETQMPQRLFAALKVLGSWELRFGDSEANCLWLDL